MYASNLQTIYHLEKLDALFGSPVIFNIFTNKGIIVILVKWALSLFGQWAMWLQRDCKI